MFSDVLSASLTEGVVVVSHDIGEGIRDVSAGDDLLRLVRFVRKLDTMSNTPASTNTTLTRRNEKMMHPKNSHFPIENGTGTQPLCASLGQLLKMALDQESLDNMVIAVKISDT